MNRKWKILILVLAIVIIVGGVFGGIQYSKKGVVTVQTGKVVKQDLTALVTASGEVKPRNYINIGANTMGPARIVDISVVEGQRVSRGQLLAPLMRICARSRHRWTGPRRSLIEPLRILNGRSNSPKRG